MTKQQFIKIMAIIYIDFNEAAAVISKASRFIKEEELDKMSCETTVLKILTVLLNDIHHILNYFIYDNDFNFGMKYEECGELKEIGNYEDLYDLILRAAEYECRYSNEILKFLKVK